MAAPTPSRVIDISKPTVGRTASVLLYGASGSGKTWWAAQWPRPRFFSDVVEGGYETLYDPELKKLWYEPSWTPQVRGIRTLADMNEEWRLLEDDVRRGGPTAPRTVIVDSLTFFMTLMENHYRENFAAQIEKNQYWLWQQIGQHVLRMMKKAHTIMGLSTIWTALEESGDKGAGPVLPGRTSKMLPAACKYWLYATTRQGKTTSDPPVHELRTKKCGIWPARVRGKFPDPLVPTYRAFAQAAGFVAAPVAVAR